MMNEPSIEKLTGDGLNRYQICIATSKAARDIIDGYNAEDRAAVGEDKSAVKKTVHDDKPVKTAVHAIEAGDYDIYLPGEELPEETEEIVDALDEAVEDAPLQD